MAIARRTGVALAIVGSVFTLAATTPRRLSPGYTYRLRISSRVTEPNGKTTDYLVVFGHATVTDYGGRLDVDDAPSDAGAVFTRGGYVLYDSKTMTVVSPKDRKLLRFALDDLEHEPSSSIVAGPRDTIADVAVKFESLGAGEPMLGMTTTKYRITQDYKRATSAASLQRSSTEHVVQDIWMGEERSRLANPFALIGQLRAGSGARELLARTADARSKMGSGVPLKTVTTTTSTSSDNQVTKTVNTMEVTDLQEGNIDDELLATPTGYQATEVGTLAKTARTAPGETAKPAAKGDAAQTKQGLVNVLHGIGAGLGRRPGAP